MRIRKRFRVLFLSVVIAAVVVPVGFALSLSSGSVTPQILDHAPAGAAASSVALNVPALVTIDNLQPRGFADELPDAAKLFAVGTLMFGLATLVRKTG